MSEDIQKLDRCHSLFREVSDLESFVSEALRKGIGAKELKTIVDDATVHSRRKAIILQHVDSSLLLSAVQHAKEEIGRLPEVTATNAQVMEDLEHATVSKGGLDGNPSTKSEAGGSFKQERAAAGASMPIEIPGDGSRTHSVGSSLSQCNSEMVSTPKTPAPTPWGSAPPHPSTPSAAAVVQSLRAFAAEVAEEAKSRPGPSLRALSHHLQRTKSGDAETEKSREYDFELAESPSAAYFMAEGDFNPFKPSKGDAAGSWTFSDGGDPITTDYALSSPTSKAQGGEQMQPFGRAEEGERVPGEGVGGGAAAGGRGRGRASGGEGAHCAAGVPPGLNPLAVVEGHGEEDTPGTPNTEGDAPTLGQDEEGVFGEDLLAAGYLEGYECGTVTPPKHVLQRLAQSIRRLSV